MKRHKFFLVSDSGDAAFLALRLQQEGHDVTTCILDKRYRHIYDGLIRKAQSIDPPRGSIVVFDSVNHGHVADVLRTRGFRVVGGSVLADVIEIDRPQGLAFAKKAGLQTPETKKFRSFKQARAFLESQDRHRRWVFKPSGNLNTAYTIAIDHEESLEWIEQMTRGEDNLEFELQEFVEGVEVSTEGWFDGQTFVDGSLNSTFEEKRFMDGNVGPRVGCAGNVVWFWRDDNALTRMVRSLEKPLRELKYGPGPIDVNTIVNEDGIFFLEFTARFGYDALQAQLELYEAPVGEILYDLAHGALDTFPVSTDLVAIAVRLTIPPYPTDTEAARNDIPIFFRPRDLPHLHFNDVWLKDDQLVTAGVDGSIGVASFAARSVDLAREGVYDIIDRVKVASDDLQYRKEIGLRYHADFPSLMALIQPDART